MLCSVKEVVTRRCSVKKIFFEISQNSQENTCARDTDGDITLLKCKICRKYTTQIRTEARSHNLCDQILDSILLYVDCMTYVLKINVYKPC